MTTKSRHALQTGDFRRSDPLLLDTGLALVFLFLENIEYCIFEILFNF